ncbi:hypothetical protein [Streptomyces sp. DB-54]
MAGGHQEFKDAPVAAVPRAVSASPTPWVWQEWEPEDLVEVWTLLEDEAVRLRNKTGANRLGLALLLKFFEVEARFPRRREKFRRLRWRTWPSR